MLREREIEEASFYLNGIKKSLSSSRFLHRPGLLTLFGSGLQLTVISEGDIHFGNQMSTDFTRQVFHQVAQLQGDILPDEREVLGRVRLGNH